MPILETSFFPDPGTDPIQILSYPEGRDSSGESREELEG